MTLRTGVSSRQIPFPGMLLLALALAVTTGCRVLQAPEKVVTAVVPIKSSSQPDPLPLQLELQRFSDDSMSRTVHALDDYARLVGTEQARHEALRFKLISSSSLISIASGPNPTINLLDLVSVTVLTRRVLEDYWMNTSNGPALQSWLDASRRIETNAWVLAGHMLTAAQTNELRQAIDEWYERNPAARGVLVARPQEFSSLVRTSKERDATPSSVFSLVNLDPTAGLDPAVREVTRTRLFAERAMFTLQRMPFLLRMQTELLAYDLTSQAAVQSALSNTTRLSDSAERLSRAAESVSQTAAQLPDRISTERKEILAALDQQEGKLRELAVQLDLTLTSADRMSTSLNTTITTFDRLMKRFGVGEPSSETTLDTNSRPFNILEYGHVAQQIGAMANDINTLVTSVNQSMPQVERLGQTATADAQKLVDHGFRLGLILIAILLVGAVGAGLTYRFLVARLTPSRQVPSPSGRAQERFHP